MMQSTYVDDQHHDTAPLAPEWPSAIDARSQSFDNDRLAGRSSIVRRVLRSLARFSIAVLIGVGATLAWQSYGDTAREMLSIEVPSLSWLSVSTTTPTPDAEGSAQKPAGSQSAPAQTAPPAAAATTSQFTQLEPIAHDLAAMRRSLEQLAAKQEQMAQNIAAMQAAEQDIRKKMMAQTISDQPRKPPKPPANPSPAQSPVRPPPVVQSPSQ
jgi:cytoskeletal protein RodZ